MHRARNITNSRARTVASVAVTTLAAAMAVIAWPSPAFADSSPCADGSTPAVNSEVVCTTAGNYTLAVPSGTSSVTADVVGGGGGAGYPARSHIGGNAAEVTGTLTLPAGTAYLYVIVGVAGTGDNHGTSGGGGGSAVLAEDSNHALLAKLVVAGGGGGGAYNGDGGDAGSAGKSDNAQAVSGPGQPGSGATGGAGGTGNYAAGTAGGSNNPSALAIAAGGTGGLLPSSARGGAGGGGYAGGGGGGASTQGILNTNVAGGGGGSSLASAYLGDAAILLATGTGGVQLPGLVAGDGATGSVDLTFQGLAVPGAPTGVTATAGAGQASVSFTAPANDGGSTITSYTVTSAPGGLQAACPGSPCTVTGLTNGTSYTFTVHATNGNGDSPESPASNAVTPSTVPDAPTGVTATAGDQQASVSFTAPANDGGSAITSYTVTSNPGGLQATCPGSPCPVTGLANGTSYTFTVHATNADGDSSESSASAAATPVGVPAAPSPVTVTAGHSGVAVSFPVPGDGGSDIEGYQVSVDGGQSWTTLDATTADGTVTGTVSGLDNGTTYSVEVRAVNAQGPGDSSEAQSATPVAPKEQAITFDPLTSPAVVGQQQTLSATGGGSGKPVTFSVAADSASVCTLGGTTVTFIGSGSCVLHADQAGNDDYYAAPQAEQTVTVDPKTTGVTVTLDPATTVYGQAASATATVTGGADGTVQFTLDGANLGSPVAVTGGSATSPAFGVLAPGDHAVGASFTPTKTTVYAGSDAVAQTLTVSKASTVTTVTVSAHALTATVAPVAPGTGTPGGTVTFSLAGTTVGIATLDQGTATLAYDVPAGMTQTVGAAYAGSEDFLVSSASTARRDPSITATVSSSTAKSRYGWYRSPVTVRFTCTVHGAALTAPCPHPVTLSGNGAGQSVSRTIAAVDGGMATATVSGIGIDRTAPSVAVTGVRNGGTYTAAPRIRCVGKDALSGIAICALSRSTHGNRTSYRATAVDKAGNSRTVSGSYTVQAYYLQGAALSHGAYTVRAGHTYTLVVVGSATRPEYIDAAPFPRHAAGRDHGFHYLGHHRWALGVTIDRGMTSHAYWNIGIKIGHTVHQIKIRVIR